MTSNSIAVIFMFMALILAVALCIYASGATMPTLSGLMIECRNVPDGDVCMVM